MKYMIDTNICIYIMNKRPVKVVKKFKQMAVGEIAVSSITVSELYYGAGKSGNPRRNKERVRDFLLPFVILPYDERAAVFYGDIRSRLERHGKPIGPLDTLIAAHALSQNLTLITNNEKEFQRIEGLAVENWVR
ncbi:MAG: type II toxin-antitoxin system VapC family toxin [Chloroflexi bacterium]|nr:type II toxin-antitoxin system VapC family toxin [Chloroflexota bacterium]